MALFSGLGIGEALALSYKQNYGRDIAMLHQEEALDRQAKADAMNRAKLLTDDLKFPEVSNPYDSKIVKDLTYLKLNDIGRFVHENPDVYYNPAKYIALQQKKNDIINNDPVLKGKRVDMEIKKHREYAVKNPDYSTTYEYEANEKNLKNYINSGDINNEGGKNREFVWISPDDTDIEKIAQDSFGRVKPKGINVVPSKVKGHMTKTFFYTPEQIEEYTESFLLNPSVRHKLKKESEHQGIPVDKMAVGIIEKYLPQFKEEEIKLPKETESGGGVGGYKKGELLLKPVTTKLFIHRKNMDVDEYPFEKVELTSTTPTTTQVIMSGENKGESIQEAYPNINVDELGGVKITSFIKEKDTGKLYAKGYRGLPVWKTVNGKRTELKKDVNGKYVLESVDVYMPLEDVRTEVENKKQKRLVLKGIDDIEPVGEEEGKSTTPETEEIPLVMTTADFEKIKPGKNYKWFNKKTNKIETRTRTK